MMSNLSSSELNQKKTEENKLIKRKLRILKLADKIFVENLHDLTYGLCIVQAERAEDVKELYLKGE